MFQKHKKGRTGFGFRKVPECRRIAFEIVAKGGPLPRIPAQRLRVTPSQTPITPQILSDPTLLRGPVRDSSKNEGFAPKPLHTRHLAPSTSFGIG